MLESHRLAARSHDEVRSLWCLATKLLDGCACTVRCTVETKVGSLVLIENLSRYMYANSYHNWAWSDKGIAKIIRCSFFDSHRRFYSLVCSTSFIFSVAASVTPHSTRRCSNIYTNDTLSAGQAVKSYVYVSAVPHTA